MGAKNFLSDRARGLFRSVDPAPAPDAAWKALEKDNPELAREEFEIPRVRARRNAIEKDESFAQIEVSEQDREAARAALKRLRR